MLTWPPTHVALSVDHRRKKWRAGAVHSPRRSFYRRRKRREYPMIRSNSAILRIGFCLMMGCAAISFTNTPAGATTITQVVVEDKGLVVPVIPAVHTFPSVDVVTVVSPPEIVSVTRIHPNSEI